MSLGDIETTETDIIVAHAHALDGSTRVVLKLARSVEGGNSLRRATEKLTALRNDPQLDGWEVPRPEILAVGELDGLLYVVESALPGMTISRVLDRGVAWLRLADLATEAIDGMHRRTTASIRVDAELIDRWIDHPLRAIEPLVAAWPTRTAALGELRRELVAHLDGRRLAAARIHGDYVPSNVLMDAEAGTITGIVDWELAAKPDLPAIDRGTFLLAMHMHIERSELGALVSAIVKGEANRSLTQAMQSNLNEQFDARLLALLCWLRHVAAVATHREGYARYRAWKRHNVYPVLDALRP
jgi:Ser/Thr protein kinase RdoA (MazF antagonist)